MKDNNKEKFKNPEIHDSFEAFVKRIIDGDTYEIYKEEDPKTLFIVRLWNCDTPEKKQFLGDKITNFVEKFLLNRKITFELIETDQYARNVGKVLLHEPKNRKQDIAEYLIYKGLAYTVSDKNDDPYLLKQRDAEFNKRGLWNVKDTKKPSEFRDEKYKKKVFMIKKDESNQHKNLGYKRKNNKPKN